MGKLLFPAIVLLLWGAAAGASESRLLLGFETSAEVASVEVEGAAGLLSDEHVTQGAHCLRVSADQSVRLFRLPADWSGFDALEVDIYCEAPEPISLYVLIGDQAWAANSTYWNRYNANFPLRPGANMLSLPLGGLYRGEVGSRHNDLKTDIDVSRITRLDLGFEPTGRGGFLYLDNLRLSKWSRPSSVRAFDFGPPGQALSPGFTAVSPDSVYSEDKGWGFDPAVRPGRAWDVAFPTRLLQDSIDMMGAVFRAKLPPGRYHVLVFFEDLGYWSGEQAQYSRRVVSGRNWEVVQEHEKWGKLDFVYHFQDTEPLPGANLWDTYLSYLFQPVEADLGLDGEGFELKVDADGPGARRVAGIIIYPVGNARAARWVAEVLAAQREEFLAHAVELPLPHAEQTAPITAADRARGCVIFVPPIEQTVYFSTQPTAEQLRADLAASAAGGEHVSLTLAIRPLRDLGLTQLEVSDFRGENGVIPAESIALSVVRHLPTRSLGGLMYRIAPRYLVRSSEVRLPADLTRQLWITVRVPPAAPAGQYQGRLTLRPAQELPITVPVRLRLLPFSLDEADFITGFFGIQPDLPSEGVGYDALQRQVFRMLLDRGFTSFTGGPEIPFLGLDQAGQPKLEFARADRFLAAARQAGFHREFSSYGGFTVTGLYDQYSYTRGETGQALEQKYGLPYEEIVRRVWAAVEAHAREQQWLPFTYHLCDETRVLELAREQLELMRLFKRAAPWLQTTGSYSVSFQPTANPVELALQDFFRGLDSSMLNNHDEVVLAKARELGRKVYIYNQGQGRYSFGLYQWGERAKGIVGRYQWIAFIRHGYEYFDLDGREPDTGVIFYSSDGLRPTPELERDAEGMNDFRYLQTLENLAARAERSGVREAVWAAAEARAFLARVAGRIATNQRQQPVELSLDAVRQEASDRILGLLNLVPSG